MVNGGGDVFLGEGVDDSNGSKVLDAVEHLGLQFQKRFGPAECSLGSACKIIQFILTVSQKILKSPGQKHSWNQINQFHEKKN